MSKPHEKWNFERVKSFHPIERMFESRMATIIFSVIVAIIMWFVISITIYPTTPLTISHVPLKVDLTGTAAEADGYSMIHCDVEEVSVQIEGNRSQVGNLDETTLVAYAEIPNITTAGTKNLSIVVKSTDGTQFTVKSITPQSVNVKFDKIKTVTLDVVPDLSNVESAPGSIINKDGISVSPSTVDITGPAQVVSQIKNASVVIESATQISSATKLVSENLEFCDANGNEIVVDDDGHLQYELTQYTVDIPVQYTKEMNITYQLRNVPSTFDESFLRERMKLSAEKITLAAPDQSLTDTSEFTLDMISLSDITLDFSKNYTLDVPEGYENLSNISSVNLSLESEGLAQKDFVVNEINVINASSSYTYTPVTEQLIVTVVGNAESIEQLDPKQISVTVDLLSVQQTGEESVSFSCVPTISFERYDDVWASGDYKVIVTATKNSDSTK
ncbi:MAG: YbbR-like domain-containing protein [Ruminococcus sp.]